MKIFSHFEDVPHLGPSQRQLLDALLADAPRDRAALREWIAEVDFDALDYSSFRLMPALFAKFGDDPLCQPHHGRIKGIYRYFLVRTALLSTAARQAVAALREAGIEVLLFKGMALALKYHRNQALRAMSDVDVLVRPADIARAEEILAGLGWTYRYSAAKKQRDIHSHDYINRQKNGFDLHWFALPESPRDGIDDDLWQRAESFDWQGLPVKLMGPEDLALIAMVNGLREPEAMRCEWLDDIERLVDAAPAFDWSLLWREAGRRGVQAMVFDALLLLDRVRPGKLPADHLHRLLAEAPDLLRRRVRRLVAETRTQTLDPAQRPTLEALLADDAPPRPALARLFARPSPYRAVAGDASTVKHVAFGCNGEGAIDSLYLHRRHLPLLGQLFRVDDRRALRQLAGQFAGEEGCLAVPPGLLRLPERDTLPRYHARIRLAPGQQPLEIPAGEVGEIPLTVINDTPHCWFVRPDSPALYGVSCHLLAADGSLLQWDQPRTYFMSSRPGYLAFVPPGQKLACRLKIHAPEEPGHYRLQLDVLQETVLWFSGQKVRFPEIALHVIP